MINLDQVIAEFRNKLADHNVTFLLVYSVQNPLTETIDTRITSNSNQLGIRAILACIWRPTEQAVNFLARALKDIAYASRDTTVQALDDADAKGVFQDSARIVLEGMRGSYSVAGWETPIPNSDAS